MVGAMGDWKQGEARVPGRGWYSEPPMMKRQDSVETSLPLPSLAERQLLNKGEKTERKYSDACPWLEAAAFGGFLSTVEVSV